MTAVKEQYILMYDNRSGNWGRVFVSAGPQRAIRLYLTSSMTHAMRAPIAAESILALFCSSMDPMTPNWQAIVIALQLKQPNALDEILFFRAGDRRSAQEWFEALRGACAKVLPIEALRSHADIVPAELFHYLFRQSESPKKRNVSLSAQPHRRGYGPRRPQAAPLQPHTPRVLVQVLPSAQLQGAQKDHAQPVQTPDHVPQQTASFGDIAKENITPPPKYQCIPSVPVICPNRAAAPPPMAFGLESKLQAAEARVLDLEVENALSLARVAELEATVTSLTSSLADHIRMRESLAKQLVVQEADFVRRMELEREKWMLEMQDEIRQSLRIIEERRLHAEQS